MTGKFGFVAIAAAVAVSAAAQAPPPALFPRLTIVSGGRRIIDRDPSTASDNCHGWAYGAAPLLDDDGNVVAVYTVSDAITNHCKAALDSAERFGDVIRRHELNADGTWSAGADVITRANLPWMADSTVLAAHPESFVGHLSSPSVARIGGRYYMAFVGSVHDPNLCAGEHPATNICGSCVDPWSYFVVMWAVSDDGVNWRVLERSPGNPMLIGAAPKPGSGYKGITRVTLVTHEDGGRTYFYIGAQYWGPSSPKMLMLRVPYDPKSEWGISADPELWSANRSAWMACPGGVVPDSIDTLTERSLSLYGPLVSISRTTIEGSDEYIALMNGASAKSIAYSFSRDLVNWTSGQPLQSTIPYFADGWSYAASAIDPVVVDNHGSLRLFFASADGDEAAGISRDGKHDCDPGAGFGPTAPYVGTGIYEARVEMVTPSQTQIAMRTERATYNLGEPVRVHIDVTSADGSPVQGVIELYGYSIVYARVVDGHADVDVVGGTPGAHNVWAYYADQGKWFYSYAYTTVEITSNRYRRRAVHH